MDMPYPRNDRFKVLFLFYTHSKKRQQTFTCQLLFLTKKLLTKKLLTKKLLTKKLLTKKLLTKKLITKTADLLSDNFYLLRNIL
jgi:hypothetical protein